MTDAPERIWLQDDGDYSKARLAGDDVTWCEDQINDADTEYVRVDLHAEAPVTVRETARAWKAAREAAMKNVTPETFTELSRAESALSRALAEQEGSDGR